MTRSQANSITTLSAHLTPKIAFALYNEPCHNSRHRYDDESRTPTLHRRFRRSSAPHRGPDNGLSHRHRKHRSDLRRRSTAPGLARRLRLVELDNGRSAELLRLQKHRERIRLPGIFSAGHVPRGIQRGIHPTFPEATPWVLGRSCKRREREYCNSIMPFRLTRDLLLFRPHGHVQLTISLHGAAATDHGLQRIVHNKRPHVRARLLRRYSHI
jgi:hypothetical protein